ncbi:MAG TPA: glycosyltransferase family 1 protein [Lapillicoccus sp.]|nr:glycosyltransferase family 1 protein [Lapillicoccus sp.]
MGDEPISVRVVATQLCARVPGGTGRYVEELVRGLVRRRPDDARVVAVAVRDCAAVDRLGVDVERVAPPLPVLARLWERGLPPKPRAGGVLHAPTLMVPPVPRSTALVVTIHDVVPWTHPETLTPHGVAFHRRMGERAARDAATIVTPTEAVAARVRELLDPRGAVLTVAPGVSVTAPPPDADERRAARRSSRPYVLFVGTAEPRKGLDVLVEALTRSELADLDLVVVGPPGWGDVDIGALAAAAGVSERVHVTGRVDDADLAAWYTGARVLAMPSRAEGFGFPVVEAMAHGLPVVVTADPALTEVAAGAATVVPVGEAEPLAVALAESAADGAARAELVERGRSRAADFDWDRTAAEMWGLYGSVAPATGRTG